MTVDNAQAAPCQLGSLALSPVHKLVVLVLLFCEEDDPGTVRVKMPLLYHLLSPHSTARSHTCSTSSHRRHQCRATSQPALNSNLTACVHARSGQNPVSFGKNLNYTCPAPGLSFTNDPWNGRMVNFRATQRSESSRMRPHHFALAAGQ